MKTGSINVNGLKNRKQDMAKLINENLFDIVYIQEVHRIDQNDIPDLEKLTSGILFYNSNDGYLGTAILLRLNLQNMQVKHIEISQPSLQNRVTHLQIISNDVLHLINVYCPADHYDKDPFFKDFNIYLENLEYKKNYISRGFLFR